MIHFDIHRDLSQSEENKCMWTHSEYEIIYYYYYSLINMLHCRIVDNLDWYSEQNVVDFVNEVGRHFRLGTMLLRQSVQSRLNSEVGMSFTEFCYQIFQAYDWLHLFRKYRCRFQVGGSDQMGNIVSGHDLISRTENVQVYGMFHQD